MIKSKIETYLGFAIKSNKCVLGLDNILVSRNHISLVLVCETASRNTVEACENFSASRKIPLLKLKDIQLENLIFKKNCKVMATTSKPMTSAILANLNDNYILYTVGGNLIEQQCKNNRN